MTAPAPPAGNSANSDTLGGVMKFAFRKMLQYTDDMLPAVVVAYDRGTNRASVQPLISFVDTANQQTTRAQVASVPVLQLGGGGFVLSFPIKPGDLGWIKANDRDISVFKQAMQQTAPSTQRMHSFSDAMFIPDTMMRGVTIEGEDTENAVFQNLDGSVRIALWADQVKITAPKIILNATTEITLDTPLTTITGELQAGTNPSYTQTASFNGLITTTDDVVAQTISLVGHVHSGVQPGGGDTGGPVP